MSCEDDKGTVARGALAVELLDISKSFSSVLANKNITLGLRSGEIHALLGENGAGKSTLISILAGLQQPDSGSIRVGGRETRIDSPRHSLDLGIGIVFQHVVLAPTLSVIENLMLGRSWRERFERNSALNRFHELVETVNFNLDPEAPVSSLSLGQRQQVEIMRALWRGHEKVLILDEPTSMLTPQGVVELGEVMRHLRDRGVALLFVTHKLKEAYQLCDRVTVLRQGEVAGEVEVDNRDVDSEERVVNSVVQMMFDQSAIGQRTGQRLAQAKQDNTSTNQDRNADESNVRLRASGLVTIAEPGECPLRSVSFEIIEGEIFGVAGIDGNGQKHLAEAISGQRKLQRGGLYLGADSISQMSGKSRRQRGIRYLTDDRMGEGILAEYAIATNLVLKGIGESPFWSRGITFWKKIYAHARDLIQRHDIRTPTERTPIGRLSGGNIQKALFARELTNDATIVVYNKPTYGLDIQNIELARGRIKAGAERGISTLLISTELDEVLGLSDRIGVMYRGEMVGILDNKPGIEETLGRLMTGLEITPQVIEAGPQAG